MMAQKKARKHSSSLEELRGKTAEELADILARPSRLVQYVNQYVEERAGEAEHLLLQTTVRVRRRLLCELANTGPEDGPIRRFQKQWQSTLRAESLLDLVELGEGLRFMWRRPAIHRAERVLNEWLAGRAAASDSGQGQKAQRTKRSQPAETVTGAIPFVCSLGAGRLVPDWKDMRAMLIQGVFENWRHFSYCANESCATPHFIAKRKDQVVCDAEICKAEKQRAHALKWWHENRGAKGGGAG
jgi:hypothetical protein